MPRINTIMVIIEWSDIELLLRLRYIHERQRGPRFVPLWLIWNQVADHWLAYLGFNCISYLLNVYELSQSKNNNYYYYKYII